MGRIVSSATTFGFGTVLAAFAGLAATAGLAACSRPAPNGGVSSGTEHGANGSASPGSLSGASSDAGAAPAMVAASPTDSASPTSGERLGATPSALASPPLPASASACPPEWNAGAANGSAPTACYEFPSAEEAFRWVLAHEPSIVAVGEAHAQKGTEKITSSTKRFTDALLPALQGRASDLLVEAWAGDPRCQTEVKQVASAQAPVKQAQAETNPNEYVALGTRAKELGIQPHLLRPTCEDYAELADAGADAIGASLELIKRLTQADATKFARQNEIAKNGKVVLTYGGAMHNDLVPAEKLRNYSFGPELASATRGRYVELDVIVPEFVKDTEIWQKLPWYSAWTSLDATRAKGAPSAKATVFRLQPGSFVLLFPPSAKTGTPKRP